MIDRRDSCHDEWGTTATVGAVPKIIDHDARRREVARVAAELVAEGGIDAVTVRDVAARIGTSTGIVSHYFRDKRDLVLLTFAEAASHARERIDAVLARDGGDLAGVCDALLPLDEARRRDWQVWLAFWGRAVSDPELAAEQRRRVGDMHRTLTAVIRTAEPQCGAAEARERARRVLTLLTGIAAQAVFEPDLWTPAMQRRMVRPALGG